MADAAKKVVKAVGRVTAAPAAREATRTGEDSARIGLPALALRKSTRVSVAAGHTAASGV